MTCEQDVEIINKLGLHARAAARFVQTASEFAAEITVSLNSKGINGKSIMGVMMLAAARGSVIHIRAEGKDAKRAMKQLVALIQDRFGEGE
ncbi:MAG: HPr family phosphocarrier protein [Gammaproteobacteria bacterium]